MVLVDTSVWVEHFRGGDIGLKALLNEGAVYCHPFIVGELACGNLKNRRQILTLLNALPMALVAEHHEIMQFIETHGVAGKGIGYIDVHLLASAQLTELSLWTLDKSLHNISSMLKL